MAVRVRSRGQQQGGKREYIGAHYPFDIREGGAKRSRDGRQRYRDDIRIEHDQRANQRGGQQDRELTPLLRFGV